MAKEATAKSETIHKNLVGYFVVLGAGLMAYPSFLFGTHYGAEHGALISSQTPITSTTIAGKVTAPGH